MHKNKGASRSDWQTPDSILLLVRAVIGGPIGLDPATSPDNPTRALEFYTAALEASVDADALRRRSFKVVLDYSSGAASVVMPYVLGKIGASVAESCKASARSN